MAKQDAKEALDKSKSKEKVYEGLEKMFSGPGDKQIKKVFSDKKKHEQNYQNFLSVMSGKRRG